MNIITFKYFMINLYPIVHKVACASCGGLTTLPIDILQTKVLTNQKVNINPDELQYMFIMCNLFAFQNSIYELLTFIPSKPVRGIFAGLSITPPVIYFNIQKYYSRLKIYPLYKKFIVLTIIRELLFYVSLYSLYSRNIKYNKILVPLLSNLISFPLKIMTLKMSYPSLNITFTCIKNTAFIEILKSAIGDGVALYLIYK